jgi:hypothetical protein
MKIFRKQRLQLAAENNATKYLRYAIGEILLVVIGILIALQVNNWNDNRKNNKESRGALLSLQEDFQDNMVQIKKTAHLVDVETHYTHSLISVIDKDSLTINPDSLGLYLTVGASSWSRVKTVSSTYDALSGAGKLDLIQNKKLRKLLAEFYTTTKSGFEDEDISETIAMKITEKTSDDIYVLWPSDMQNRVRLTRKSSKLKKQAVQSVLRKHGLMGILILKLIVDKDLKAYLGNLLQLSREILHEINKELKNASR